MQAIIKVSLIVALYDGVAVAVNKHKICFLLFHLIALPLQWQIEIVMYVRARICRSLLPVIENN